MVIYLDYHSTTPCDPRVLEAMLPYFTEHHGNPSSTVNYFGRTAAAAVDAAREKVAALVGVSPSEIIFTSGATEANNLAIFGVIRSSRSPRRRIVTTATEHKSILGPCDELREQYGLDVTILPVDSEGVVSLDVAERIINEDTLLVTVQAANNEVGTIQPVADVARLAQAHGAFVHCDAAQAVGKIGIDVETLGVDLVSISSHKLYGPKGVGALYVRKGIQLSPMFLGGGQERALRPGTLNVPGIVGFGEACSICQVSLIEQEGMMISVLRDRLESILLSRIRKLHRNGALNNRLPGNSSLTFLGVDAEALIANTPSLALSTGSACSAGTMEPSHVLLALGLSKVEAYSTIRIGLGRFTTVAEVDDACEAFVAAYERIVSLSAAL